VTRPVQPGALVLVPNALDHGSSVEHTSALSTVLPSGVIQRIATLDTFVVENAKSARRLLARVHAIQPLRVPLQAIAIVELPRPRKGPATEPARGHAGAQQAQVTLLMPLLAPMQAGRDVGLVSDAGLPGVADPGAALVALAHAHAVPVEVLSGPSSLTLALAASGLQGQAFAFVGYLPSTESDRSQRIRQLEARSQAHGETQIAIETPYRNAALMSALVQTLQPTTMLSVACGLTQPGGFCRTQPVRQWAAAMPTFASDLPAVFSWLARA
jgi:16S rRNA (cytidine1402-2'-O)-methyltransferase